ncbi:hypothetical protein CFRA_04670 [Corynebacterium frankenforstense DSM 45800]|uniref:Calcineurin-like phosphoesterase domain-containing protein n=1 Tax=Corynebacterium frankenforstense DSM 45800 TaxID=1437875 RepID=A0A1L7CS54_9CORY|nr:metallophosphoesterase [Corynebacterium frankenforstense]APT88666.1 hypothetical protein CFRA_04670 [Corynebacterium frankenforstense DSM 45800]
MTEVTFLHTSDLQLGMERHFLDEKEALPRYTDARIDAITRLGEIAAERGCAFIVMAGDVFEMNSVTKLTFGRAVQAFRELPVDCYLLPGNHDALNAASVLRRVTEEPGMDHVHLLDGSGPVAAAPGVEIIGAPLTARETDRDLVTAAVAELEPTADIRVVVGHGQPTSYGDERLDHLDVAGLGPRFADGTIDYLALGDTHSTLAVEPEATGGRAWFSGAPEVTAFREPDGGGEADSGNALVVTVRKDGVGPAEVDVDKVRVGRWRFQALAAEINSDEDVADFLETLNGWEDKKNSAVKYALTGSVGLAQRRELERGIAALEPVFASLRERTRLMDLHTAPSAEEIADSGMTGFVAETLDELVEAGETDAVNLLFRLYETEENR